MDWPVGRRRGMAALGGMLLLLAAAAPGGPLLVFDPSALDDEGCLAPAAAGCRFAGTGAGSPSPSASAALIEPPRPAVPRLRLEADLGEIFEYGPQLAFRRSSAQVLPKMTPRPAAVTCLPRLRHRPDRSVCKPKAKPASSARAR